MTDETPGSQKKGFNNAIQLARQHPRLCACLVFFIVAAILAMTWGEYYDERAYISFSSGAGLFSSSNRLAISGEVTPIHSLLVIFLYAILDWFGVNLPAAALIISAAGWGFAALSIYELVTALLAGQSRRAIGFFTSFLLLLSPLVISTLATEIPWLIALGGAALLLAMRKDWKRFGLALAFFPLLSIEPGTIAVTIFFLLLLWREKRRFPLPPALVLAMVTAGCMAVIYLKSGKVWPFAITNLNAINLKNLFRESELYWLFVPLIAAGLFGATNPGRRLINQTPIQAGKFGPITFVLWGAVLFLTDGLAGSAVLGAAGLVLAGMGIDWLIQVGLTIDWSRPAKPGLPAGGTGVYLAAILCGAALLVPEVTSLSTRYQMRPAAYRQLESQAAGWLREHSEPGSVVLGSARLGFLAGLDFHPWDGGQNDEQSVPELTAGLLQYPVDIVVSSRSIAWTELTHTNWFKAEFQPVQEFKSPYAASSPLIIWGPMDGPYQQGEIHPLQVNTTTGASLVGYKVWPESIQGGGPVYVTLYWRSEELVQEAFQTVVRMISPVDKTALAQQDIISPRSIPASWWEPGLVIPEYYELEIPAGASTGAYEINVSLRMPRSNDLLQMNAGDDPNPVDRIKLGYVSAPWQGEQPAGAIPVQAAFGDRIQLDSVLLENDLAPGGKFKVTCYWEALAKPDQDYTVFVHLVDQNGEMISSHDSPPMNGAYTTLSWYPGSLVPDKHTLSLPDQLPALPYRLLIGLYIPSNGERLPIHDSQGNAVPDGFITIPIE